VIVTLFVSVAFASEVPCRIESVPENPEPQSWMFAR